MATTLRLYHNQPGSSVLALSVLLNDDGTVGFVPGAEHAEDAMKIVGGAVWWGPKRRTVTPADGLDYLRAVTNMLGRSTVWSVVVEEGSPRGTEPPLVQPS
jgi:hypothetical protein